MPIWNLYPALGADIADDDIFLVWKTSDGTVRSLEYSDFLAQIEADFNLANAVSLPTTGVTLDASYQYVAPNSGSPLTITIPVASSFPGQEYKIFNKGSGAVTLQRSSSDTLAGQTAIVLAQYDSAILISDGVSQWGVFQ